MKYAHKLMVVPYIPRIENPVEIQIFTLDQQMESVLNDRAKTIDDKIKLYNQILMKYNTTLQNFNLSNKPEQLNYVDTLSSQVAEKMYSKIKPDLDSINEKEPEKIITKRIFHIRPKNTNKRRIKKDRMNEDFNKTAFNEELYRTAYDNTKLEMSDDDDEEVEVPQTTNAPYKTYSFLDVKTPEESDESSNKKVTITTDDTADLYMIKTSANNKQYIVPPKITEDAFNRMQEAAPNGVLLEDIIKYLKKDGRIDLKQTLQSDRPNLISKQRNNFFIQLNKKFKQQDGEGLKNKKKKHWTFKSFF